MLATARRKYLNLLLLIYAIACKRIILDSRYLAAIHNDKIFLTDKPIRSVDTHNLKLDSGKHIHADVMAC